MKTMIESDVAVESELVCGKQDVRGVDLKVNKKVAEKTHDSGIHCRLSNPGQYF